MMQDAHGNRMAAFDPLPPIIVFDGHCRLCLASLRFIERHDHAHRFRYLPFQAAAGRLVSERLAMDPEALDSFVLLDEGRAMTKTAAWCRILMALGPPWSWLGRVARWVPAALGDRVYDLVGRNRVRWFGRLDACPWPLPDDPLAAEAVQVTAALDAIRTPAPDSGNRARAPDP